MDQIALRECLAKYINIRVEMDKPHDKVRTIKLQNELKEITTDLSSFMKHASQLEIYWHNKLDRIINLHPLNTVDLKDLLHEIQKHMRDPKGTGLSDENLIALKDKMSELQGEQNITHPDITITLHRQSESGDYWIIAREPDTGIVSGCCIKTDWLRSAQNITRIALTRKHNEYLTIVEDKLILV